MPKARTRAVSGAGSNKLKQLLHALVTDPEAACLGGNDLCCAGCNGNSDLVDSLCAFCLHSDVARKYFADNGGLDALLLATRNTNSDKTALAALQVMACLCTTRLGQALVVQRRPELLYMVLEHASNQDEEREGLQHAALSVLTGWASEDSDSAILQWLRACPPHHAAANNAQPGAPEQTAPFPIVFGSDDTDVDMGSPCSSSAPEPVLVHIASRALMHPTLALRKAGAELLAVAASNPSLPDTASSAVARIQSLAEQVQQVLQSERDSIGLPQFAAFANGGTQLMLDPMAFLRQQEQIHRSKVMCHALLHVACEFAPTPACTSVLGRVPNFLLTVLDVFESSWQVSAARINTERGGTLTQASDLPFSFLQDHQSRELALDAVTSVLRRPTMLANLGHSLEALGDSSQPQGQPSQQHPATTGTSKEARSSGCGGGAADAMQHSAQGADSGLHGQQGEAAQARVWEEQALQALTQLVNRLLTHQSAGHVRAALTILGHVRFDNAPGRDDGVPWGSSVHSQWLGHLRELFDATWRAEVAEAVKAQQPQDTTMQGSSAPAANPSAPAQLASGGGSTTAPDTAPDTVMTSEPTAGDAAATTATAAWPLAPSASGGQAVTQPAAHADQAGGPGTAAGSQPPATFMLDVGLGYRVLVQVLQAWKTCLESRAPCVLTELAASGYLPRVVLATSHPRPPVAQAAWKILRFGQQPPPDEVPMPGALTLQQGPSWGDWGAWNGFSSGQGLAQQDAAELNQSMGSAGMAAQHAGVGWGAPGQVPGTGGAAATAAGYGAAGATGPPPEGLTQEEADMQEFLSVFLESGDGGVRAAGEQAADTAMAEETAPLPSVVELPPAFSNVTVPTLGAGQGEGAQGNYDATVQGAGVQGPGQGASAAAQGGGQQRGDQGLFSGWDALPDQEEEAVLQEALMMLPDLESMAQNMSMQGPAVLNKRPGAALASPLSMLML